MDEERLGRGAGKGPWGAEQRLEAEALSQGTGAAALPGSGLMWSQAELSGRIAPRFFRHCCFLTWPCAELRGAV